MRPLSIGIASLGPSPGDRGRRIALCYGESGLTSLVPFSVQGSSHEWKQQPPGDFLLMASWERKGRAGTSEDAVGAWGRVPCGDCQKWL